MLKHILTGQPSSTAGSRLHHHHEYLAHPAAGTSGSSRFPLDHSSGNGGGGLHHGESSRGIRSSIRAQSSADVYDNAGVVLGQRAGPQYQSGHRLHHHHQQQHPRDQVMGAGAAGGGPLNHSQLSVNNLTHRLNASQHSHHGGPLNLSTLSTSKHSVNSVSPVVGAHLANYAAERSSVRHHLHHQHQLHHQQQQQHLHNFSMTSQSAALVTQLQQHAARHSVGKPNGGLDISRMSARFPSQPTPSPGPVASASANAASVPTLTTATATTATTTSTGGPSIVPLNSSWSSSSLRNEKPGGLEPSLKEVLSSLGLLCLVSLLLALISLTLLIRMPSVSLTPNSLISTDEFTTVYDVTLVLCALALILNLCCLLVCAIQFLFAVKLVKAPYHGQRTNKYLQKSSICRVCAIGGFFISIPVFLTGIILYAFIQFESTPAIVTAGFIGLGIVFCGCALVHTVFIWQKEKTNTMKALRREQYEAAAQLQRQQTLHNHHQQQQQQQQQQQHQQPHQNQLQQQQARNLPVTYVASSSRLAEPRALGSSAGAVPGPQHQLHGHRHISPLLIPSSVGQGQLNVSQRSGQVLGPASPPATPGDRSPIGPAAHKHNRSQQQILQSSREAAGSVSPGLPTATLDLSSAANTNSPHELSTLV